MSETNRSFLPAAFVLGLAVVLGLGLLGYQGGRAAIAVKTYERTVKVKGLAEREMPADIVIWPIQFTAVGSDLAALYQKIGHDAASILAFLKEHGLAEDEISSALPALTDRFAQGYDNTGNNAEYRYTALQTLTVYSHRVDAVRQIMDRLPDLGRQGIVFSGGDFQSPIEYLFTGLNEIKPAMVEEATVNAREVADKFAADSSSALGKIKRASQGQFSIEDRDKNTPYVKKVRIVSTIEYYLLD